jgi:uncharacterized membrane protein
VGFVPGWKDNKFTSEELAMVVLGDKAINYIDIDAAGKYFYDCDYAGPIPEIENMTAYNAVISAGRDNALKVFNKTQAVDTAIKNMKEAADKAIVDAKK